MATDVKWIKFMVGTFDGESFKKIKRAKIDGVDYRDKLTSIWFELLDFAGKCNQAGMLIGSNEVPFSTYEDIAAMIDRAPDELERCMKFFVKERMIEIIDNIYSLANWSKYQNVNAQDALREYNREKQRESRARKRVNDSVNDKSMTRQENVLDCQGQMSKNALISISRSKTKRNDRSNKEITTTKKRENTREQIEEMIESYPCIEEVKRALRDYLEMRDSKGAKPTVRAIELMLKRLEELSGGSDELKAEILDQSTMNSWTGIFAYKGNGQKPESERVSAYPVLRFPDEEA